MDSEKARSNNLAQEPLWSQTCSEQANRCEVFLQDPWPGKGVSLSAWPGLSAAQLIDSAADAEAQHIKAAPIFRVDFTSPLTLVSCL